VSAVLTTSVVQIDDATILRVTGEVDLANADVLGVAVRNAAAGGEGRTVVDLTEVTYIDSAGLATLHRAWRRSRDEGGELIVVVPHGSPCARTFEVASLDWPVVRSLPDVTSPEE
jgi:anti-anti-sigma factor